MTYSIVAYDSAMGQFGVAVQTHSPAVGNAVPWLKPAIGAIATQARTNISFGPLGLALLSGGLNATQTLAALLATDADAAQRQVAVIDSTGLVAVHTGSSCIPFAGHRTGQGYAVQANMMLHETVPDAMAKAFEASSGPLMQRLMAALEAAEAEGGDIRGSESAAIKVVSNTTGPEWDNIVCDLRVDKDEQPVQALRQLVNQQHGYDLEQQGYELVAAGDVAAAVAAFATARAAAPDSTEMQFWQAIALASKYNGLAEARLLLNELCLQEPQWRELVRRLQRIGAFEQHTVAEQLLLP